MTPSVRYDRRRDAWYFGDERRSFDGAGALVIKRNDLLMATATDLRRALRLARDHGAEPETVLIDTAPDDEYAPKESFVDLISFILLADGQLAVRLDLVSDHYVDDGAELHDKVIPLIEPLLKRSNARLVRLDVDSRRTSAPYLHEAVITTSSRNKTLEDLYQVAAGIGALYGAAEAGHLTRDTVVDLIAGGRADLLLNQPEGPWLDVKSQHYDLASPKGKISLAQAVSRFANAEEGGIVVVGMGTKKIPGGELIHSIKPVTVDTAVVRRYRQAIENCLFPFPVGLEIRLVEITQGEGLVLVSLPPQEEELKPFLVHGAIVENRIEGGFISIVRRSGEDSIPITAQQIHSTLAAGRALLRRGYVQPLVEGKSKNSVPPGRGSKL